MFTVEVLPDVGTTRRPVGSAETEEELHALLEDRNGTYMIHCGGKKVRWMLEPVARGPHWEAYAEWFRVQLGEIVEALTAR